MNIKMYCVGKIKEKYLKQGIEEYSKRLRTYYNVEIQEVADEKAPEKMSLAEMEQIKRKEGEKVLKKLKETDYVFALAIDGKQLSSEKFAKAMDQLGIEGKKQIVFIIGGSLGLSTELLQRANQQLSFGKLTYPHQLMRLVLVEQIYRVARINSGHTYHK